MTPGRPILTGCRPPRTRAGSQETFYLLWRQGVNTITWFQIRDQLPEPSFAATNQSGVFLNGGAAKPAARAFRFPLVAERAGRTSLRIWGRSPLAGQLTIERRVAGRWRADAPDSGATRRDVPDTRSAHNRAYGRSRSRSAARRASPGTHAETARRFTTLLSNLSRAPLHSRT